MAPFAPGRALRAVPHQVAPGKSPTSGSIIRQLPKPIASRSGSAFGVFASSARTVITVPVTRAAAQRLAAAARRDSLTRRID